MVLPYNNAIIRFQGAKALARRPMTPQDRKARALLRVHLADIDSTDMFIESTSEEQAAIIQLARQLRKIALEAA